MESTHQTRICLDRSATSMVILHPEEIVPARKGQRSERSRRAAPKRTSAPRRQGPWKLPDYMKSVYIVRLTRELSRGQELSVEQIADAPELGGEGYGQSVESRRRTAQRWLKGLRIGFFNGDDYSAILVLRCKEGRQRAGAPAGTVLVRDEDEVKATPETRIVSAFLEPTAEARESTPLDLLPVYLAHTALQVLNTILPAKEVDEVWQAITGQLSSSQQIFWLGDFDRKLASIPFMPKDYTDLADRL